MAIPTLLRKAAGSIKRDRKDVRSVATVNETSFANATADLDGIKKQLLDLNDRYSSYYLKSNEILQQPNPDDFLTENSMVMEDLKREYYYRAQDVVSKLDNDIAFKKEYFSNKNTLLNLEKSPIHETKIHASLNDKKIKDLYNTWNKENLPAAKIINRMAELKGIKSSLLKPISSKDGFNDVIKSYIEENSQIINNYIKTVSLEGFIDGLELIMPKVQGTKIMPKTPGVQWWGDKLNRKIYKDDWELPSPKIPEVNHAKKLYNEYLDAENNFKTNKSSVNEDNIIRERNAVLKFTQYKHAAIVAALAVTNTTLKKDLK